MSSSFAARKALSNFLTAPSKVAQALDWRKASGGRIMSMTITKNKINLAVASHPDSSSCCDDDYTVAAAQSLPSIPLTTQVVNNKKVLSPAVAEELASILDDWKVCGLVVSWPLQEEGWVGAPCGRTLHALDQLVQLSSDSSATGSVINSKRKVCLWNESHTEFCEDEWGRSPVYAHTSTKTLHVASRDQYETPASNLPAAQVWEDFCRAHWPELYQYNDANNLAAAAPEQQAAATTWTAPASKNETVWLSNSVDDDDMVIAAAML